MRGGGVRCRQNTDCNYMSHQRLIIPCILGELCGETVYDPAKEDCCCGKIETKKYGYQCCGMKYYNTRTKKCCNNQRAILVPIGGNCP
jgi:hypothetical protein